MTSNDDLRARLALLEQELKNKIARVTQSTLTKGANLQGARRNAEQHSGSSSIVEKNSSHILVIKKDLPNSTRKNFKWTAPTQMKNTELVSLKSHSSPISISSNSRTPVSNQATRPVASIAETTVVRTTDGKESSLKVTNRIKGCKTGISPTQAPPNVSLLLAKIRMINEEASLLHESFSINTNSNSLNNTKSPLNKTSIMKKSTNRKSEVKASRLLHKWTSNSVKSATKAGNRRKDTSTKAPLDDKGRRDLGGKGKKKKSWKKQDGDFVFVPIATHQYCMFFNKLGSCRSGSNW